MILTEFQIELLWKQYSIKTEKDLSLILNYIWKTTENSSFHHWNILHQLNKNLNKIICTNKGFISCLNELNENNSLFFLIKIKENLSSLIWTSLNLSELLSKLKEETNKLILIKVLKYNWLSSFIKDINDLGNLFMFIYSCKNQKTLIDLLWQDFFKEIFLNTNEIKIILKYLHDSNKDYLIDILWLQNLKLKIKNYKNLSLFLKGLTYLKCEQLLSLFEKEELNSFFQTKPDYLKFLNMLSENKVNLILRVIPYENIWWLS